MMRVWQATRSAHCVIAHTRPSFASSSFQGRPTQLSTLQYHTSLQSTQNRPSLIQHNTICTPPRNSPHTRPPTISTTRTMSDDAYAAFLDKANSDLDAGRSKQANTSSSARTETVDVNAKIPTPLTSVDAYYVSDADEPFEPVALKWEGALRGDWPDSSHFSKLISPNADLSSSIETLSTSSFDPKNQYASVLRAVRAAAVEGGSGDENAVEVKVYRVEVGTSRVEYYVVALDGEGTVVGLRAKAIES